MINTKSDSSQKHLNYIARYEALKEVRTKVKLTVKTRKKQVKLIKAFNEGRIGKQKLITKFAKTLKVVPPPIGIEWDMIKALAEK